MIKEMIYRVYDLNNDKIYEGRLDSKEIKNFTNKGYNVIKTGSFVKSR